MLKIYNTIRKKCKKGSPSSFGFKIKEHKNFFRNIGIRFFLVSKGIKTELYKKQEDFVVEEIQKDGKVFSPQKESLACVVKPEKKYIHTTLVKRGISTFEACSVLANDNGFDYFKDISFCGLKDTNALTTQRICIKTKGKLKYTIFPKFFLKKFKSSNKKIKQGDHRGNHFIINTKIKKQSLKTIGIILKNFKSLLKKGLPNFYGPQRFGIRQSNHKLGKLLIKKRYDDFIFRFLTEKDNNERKELKEIRKKIKDNYGSWKSCASILNSVDGLSDEKELVSNLLTRNKFLSIKKMKLSNFFCLFLYKLPF
ncbi:MAG: tRNA pseudouridine(13) synthase TruD [bacterium]|nr:tRNA pseudouridine(13) synthase TruD [bacterium]